MKKSILMSFSVVFVFIILLCAFISIVYDYKIFSAVQFISMGFLFLIQYMINKDNGRIAFGKTQLLTSLISFAVGVIFVVIYVFKK